MIELKSKLWQRLITICTITTVFSLSLLSAISFSQAINKPEEAIGGTSTGKPKRSQCSELQNDQLKALVPQNNEVLTTKKYPDFWFYLPFGKSSPSRPAKFRLLDEQKNSVLSKPLQLSLPDKKGIVKLSLPPTEQALAIGQRYHWYFNITCVDQGGAQSNISVDGWIKRVEPDSILAARLKQTKPQDNYFLYFENNIWADALSQLAEYRTIHHKEWMNTLSKYKLEKAVSEPISELKLCNTNETPECDKL